MNARTLIRYMLIGLTVVILGALAGWFFFLRSQTTATTILNAARGFSTGISATPFGGGANVPGATSGDADAGGKESEPPQLWHVATVPVGGAGFATTTAGVRMRYAERATGYIFDADPVNGAITRVSNTLAPKIYEALFASGGRVIERSVDDSGSITTGAGYLNASTSVPFVSTALAKNILSLDADPGAAQLVFIRAGGNGIIGYTAGWDGSKQKQVFSSPLLHWRVKWLADGRLVFVQSASDSLAGYAYTLSPKGTTPEKLLGPLPGLTVLPKSNSSAILYGTSSGGGLSLFVRPSATTTDVRLAISAPADKCVWMPGTALIAYCAVPQTTPAQGFLDAWYRGEQHSSDAIWRIDAGAGQAQLVFTPSSNVSLDMTNLATDPAGLYIAFINAVDGSPWLLRLAK